MEERRRWIAAGVVAKRILRPIGALVAMLKAIAQTLALNAFLCLLLFLPAGTLAWPQAWIFLAIFNGWSQAIGVWLLKTNPELLAERMKSPVSADQRPRDRLVMVAIGLFLCVWLVFIASDARRFGWSHVPLGAQAIGAALIVGAFYGWIGVLRANSFAAVTVRLQKERGQTVISTGPYAVVRHPMYAYTMLLLIGAPLLLESLWGLLGVTLAMLLVAARALGEEALLMDELPGYREYASKVRFRLLPGIW
jgi:protein-S-isoprenylcysteine O-methyltransferase Ste14